MSLLILWIGIGATVLLGAIVKYRSTERKLNSVLSEVLEAPRYNMEALRAAETVPAPEQRLHPVFAEVVATREPQLAAAA